MVVPGLLLCFVPDVTDTKAPLLPPFPLSSRSRRFRSIPPFRSLPRSRLRLIFSITLPSPSPSCGCSIVSTNVPVPWTKLSPRYGARAQAPGLASRASGCPRASLPVRRDDGACGIKVPAVQQKRIDAEDVLLAFPPPDAATRGSVNPISALPV